METNNRRKSEIATNIDILRSLFSQHEINAYIVPSTDEYQNEYVPDYARRLEYITGFTGSNGIAVILKEQALLFTDGRYITQSKDELDQNLFTIHNLNTLNNFEWHKLCADLAFGYDPYLFTHRSIKPFSNLSLKTVEPNLIDQIWKDQQPARSSSPLHHYPIEFTGSDSDEKIKKCRQFLSEHVADSLILTSPDSICWLLNIRAHDIEFSPLMLGISIITKEKIYVLLDDPHRWENIQDQLQDVICLEIDSLKSIILDLTGTILIDDNYANIATMELLKSKTVKTIVNPCIIWQSVKNQIEINNAIDVHIKDAVAVCECLAYIDCKLENLNLSEYELSIYLTELRTKHHDYIIDSFATICGFRENSAIIHYRPNIKNSKEIIGDGILLIDSGGHYFGGTTDITRTIVLGKPTCEQKQRYTEVLKGHIALATIKFPDGTCGANLDILARQFLWRECSDYAHGTGHGVGNCLNVHEGPQSINQKNNVPLKLGMILSNEPGYYIENDYGIRIENLMYIKQTNNPKYLQFENLTLVPYDKNLINRDMLSLAELEYIKNYYQKILSLVSPLLSPLAKKWLVNQNIN